MSASTRSRVGGGVQEVEAVPTEGAATPNAKRKRTRSPSVAKPAYIVAQMLDESGTAVAFDKRRLKIVSVERQADKVLELTETGEYPNAFYLSITVPAGSRAGSPNKPKE